MGHKCTNEVSSSNWRPERKFECLAAQYAGEGGSLDFNFLASVFQSLFNIMLFMKVEFDWEICL